MDARAAVQRVGLPAPFSQRLGQALAISLLVLLALAGILICLRRTTGVLAVPLPAGVLIGLGGLLALSALTFRSAFLPEGLSASRVASYLTWAAPSVVLLFWSAGLTLHDASPAGLVGLCGLLLVEEGWSWGRLRPGVSPVKESASAGAGPNVNLFESSASRLSIAALDETDGTPEDLEAISQRVVRRRQDDGREGIEGWVRAEFSTGQRHAAAHLAICPPWDRVPDCYAEQMGGPAAEVKIGQVLPYGVRFDIKLDRPADEPTSVGVEFSIQEQKESEG